MIDKKFLDNTIIVTNYAYKEKILKDISKDNKLYNVKFMDIKEIKKHFYFDYDLNAIYYIIKNYKVNIEIAKTYLDNLYYLTNYTNSNKLSFLHKLKEELMSHDLLIFDHLFLDYIKNKKIIFYNYNNFDKLELSMIESLKKITDVTILEKKYNNINHNIYHFLDINEECEYVAKEICNLLDKGVSLENIYITNLDSDYDDVIKSTFNMYNLNINTSKDRLISTKIASDFLSSKGNIEERVNLISSIYKNNSLLDSIISICNKYISLENIDIVLEMITYEFKNTYLKNEKTKNEIKVIDFKNYPITDDDYVFLLNFNQNAIPKVYKDEDYLSDLEKENTLALDAISKNKNERISTINNLKSIKNLYITFKSYTYFDSFDISNLSGDLGYDVIDKKIDYNISYSSLRDKLNLKKMTDKYLKTGSIDKDLNYLYSNYSEVKNNVYDNKFKSINKEEFLSFIDNKFNLSYTSMDSYYKCPFTYYLSNVLNLNIFEDAFYLYIGNVFHYTLEHALKEKEDISTLVDRYVKESERVLTKKEKFFIENLKDRIKFAYDVILEQLDNSNFDKMLFENKFEVQKTLENVTVTFKGFVDKMIYKEEDDITLLSIVDYKTGYTDTDLSLVPFGLSMQLPVYLYLAKGTPKLNNVKIAGFYLQRILSPEPNIERNKSYEDLKREELRLNGYSNSNQDILHEFDNTYKNSKYIKSMSLKKDETFNHYAKVLNDEEITNLSNMVDKKIDGAISGIVNAKFDITPKKYNNTTSCIYCKYKDICYKEVSDYKEINPDKELSYLKEDSHE